MSRTEYLSVYKNACEQNHSDEDDRSQIPEEIYITLLILSLYLKYI